MRTRTAAFLAAALLVLAGCGTATTASEDAAGAQEPAASTGGSETAASGDLADLSFSARTLDGDSFDGQTLADKPTVLWFWAPWCPTCRAQAPGVARLADEYAGRVNVVGVGGLADAADIRDVARQIEGPLHLVDEEGEVWRHFGVTAQSTYLVLDAEGGVVAEGYLDDPVLADKVAGLAD
jgi:thiol-disulfide isomerase/thioredoxin